MENWAIVVGINQYPAHAQQNPLAITSGSGRFLEKAWGKAFRCWLPITQTRFQTTWFRSSTTN